MAKRRKNSSMRFALWMILYALVFVVIFAVFLRIEWSYIDRQDKELTEPSHAIERYIGSFDSAHIRALSADFVSTLDHRVKSEEDSYAVIEGLFAGQLHYAKIGRESTEERQVYSIRSDDRTLGTMALESGEKLNGITQWNVTDEQFEFSDLLESCELLVPAEWQVSCGGAVLDESYITETGIRYPSMEEAYNYGFSLPTLVRYRIGNYIGDLTLSVVDAEGNETTAKDDPSAYTLGDRCTQNERDRFEDFTKRFLPLYIAFMSNTNHNAYDNYARVKNYLLRGSDLDNRFIDAIAGQVYSHSKGDYLHDVVVHGVFDLGGGRFLIDVDYQVDTTGNAGTVANEAGMLIVAEDQQKDGIFASELFIK